MLNIIITTTDRRDGKATTKEFSTERGAYDYVVGMIYHHTKQPKRLCEDVAEMLCDPRWTVTHRRYSHWMWTITRTR